MISFDTPSVAGAPRAGRVRAFAPKWAVEQHLARIGVPATVLRPVSFMDNYVDPAFGLQTGTLATAVAADVAEQLIALDDIGTIVERVFAAPERYRPDNNYDLGSFFSAVKGRHGDLLKKAADSASSWDNQAARQQVKALKAGRAGAMLAQDGENWAINALVHNNDWATMSKADFAPVVEACQQFTDLFACSNDDCDSWIYVVGMPGGEEALRCSCGTLNLNLRRK
jgi:hypothetical protein